MKLKDWLILLVLLCAGIHSAQCTFYDNTSALQLDKYERGQERMPFQGRVAMIPVLRWAHSHYAAYAASIGPDVRIGREPYSPEKYICTRVGILSMIAIVLMCAHYGRRVEPDLWWICPGLAIAAFYISSAARVDHAIWYPYDMPHAALFTGACLTLLSGRWPLMAALFLADVPMRETSLYLLPCLLAIGWVEGRRLRAAVYAGLMALVWLIARLVIEHRFRANVSDVGIHAFLNRNALLHPHFWPQLASIIGFLWIPLALGWRWLRLPEQAFLAGALPGFFLSFVFGIWYETRVWLEWNAMAACLSFAMLANYLNSRKVHAQASHRGETGSALQAASR